jgi:hypothetical protein
MNDDENEEEAVQVEKIIINVGLPKKISYPLLAFIIICESLSFVVELPGWIWWMNGFILAGMISYTAYDYYRVRKFIGRRHQ